MPFLAIPALGLSAGATALGVAGIGAGLYGAHKTASATAKAAQAATQASDQNNTLQRDIYNQNTALQQPFINQGTQANGQINNILQSNPFSYDLGNFQQSPGYEFTRSEALRGVGQENAFGVGIHSGAALKALQDRAAGIASQGYNDWFNQANVQNAGRNNATSAYLGALGGQQQIGAGAANALSGVGTNYANQTGQNNMFAANQVGNAALVGAGNTNSMIGNGINAAANYFGSRSSYQNPNPPAPIPSWSR